MNSSVLSPAMVELSCMADGVPVTTITWIMSPDNGTDSELSSSMDNINIESMTSGLNRTSTLTIDPTSALDTASYRCRAENSVFGAFDSDVAYVTVYGKSYRAFLKHTIIIPMSCLYISTVYDNLCICTCTCRFYTYTVWYSLIHTCN